MTQSYLNSTFQSANKIINNIIDSSSRGQAAPGGRAVESFEQQGIEPPKAKPLLGSLSKGWQNFNFRTKLTLLLLAGAALPVIATTQGIVMTVQRQLLPIVEENLLSVELRALEAEIDNAMDEIEEEAKTLAQLVEARNLDVSNPAQGAAVRELMDKSQEPDPDESFYLLTDAQGRTVAQSIQIVEEDFSRYPLLPKEAEIETQYRPVLRPTGIELGDVPIIRNALKTERPLSGAELIEGESLQRLGLAQQADIGLRDHGIEKLPQAQQPFPEGTYEIDRGRAGLTLMAVQPIRFEGKVVGTAVIGTLINRNHELVDELKAITGVSTATIFAQDWRVSTSVPYTDGETRAVGTRASREVAEKVLNQKETFIGETKILGSEYVTAYSPIYDHQQEINPNRAKPVGMVYVGEPLTALPQVRQSLRNLTLTGYGVGGGILFLAGLAAVPIASSFSGPLRRLVRFAQQVGAGEKGLRLEASDRQDEIGILAQEMNQMVTSLETNEELLRQEAEQSRLFAEITSSRLLGEQDLDNAFNQALSGVRQILQAERIVIYRFNSVGGGYISNESVEQGWPSALNSKIKDRSIQEHLLETYRQGRVVATNDVFKAGFHKDHLKLLERLQIKANLVVPLLNQGKLFGLVAAHHCSGTHEWQPSEINCLRQLAGQLGTLLDRFSFLEQQKMAEEQQREAKEQLQQRALELLMEVDPVSRGDLTIRASVTEDEIGTIADSYNAAIENLRKIVTQVQVAAQQVKATTSDNEASVRSLSGEAIRQAEEISAALDRIQAMRASIQAVAASAKQAEAVVKQATEKVEAGDAAMNRTVDGILAMRETAAETAKKVKRLGESSQKISKVVNLIGSFAAQTNLLAMNASIEATRAGEEGQGFAVIADEVQSLARQSAQASAEIEKLVAGIQLATNEVVVAMEEGTEQVSVGTKLVEETRQSLNQIAAASTEIDQLVEAIAQAAVEQSQASQAVTQTITDVAAIADKTSTDATQVSTSFKQMLAVTQSLQESVSKFKVK